MFTHWRSQFTPPPPFFFCIYSWWHRITAIWGCIDHAPQGRRCYKSPRKSPARDRHVAAQLKTTARGVSTLGQRRTQKSICGTRLLLLGRTRTVKRAELSVFLAALNVCGLCRQGQIWGIKMKLEKQLDFTYFCVLITSVRSSRWNRWWKKLKCFNLLYGSL